MISERMLFQAVAEDFRTFAAFFFPHVKPGAKLAVVNSLMPGFDPMQN